MTRNTSGSAPRRARSRFASFRPVSIRLQVSPRSAVALFVAWALLLPPPAFASRGANEMGAPPALAWAFASLTEAAKKILPGVRGRHASAPPARARVSAARAPASPPTRQQREANVTQLAVPALPLNLTPPPLDPPDPNVQVYGPLVLRSREPINLTALPLDADGDAVHGVQPWWYSSDRSVVFVSKDGQAVAGNPGTALLTAHLNTIRAVVVVEVVPNSEKFGGQKPDSTRTLPSTPPLPTLGRHDGAGVSFVKAGWSTDAGARRAGAGARGVKFMTTAAAAQINRFPTGRRRPDYEERLPDDETDSMYEQRNDVGRPPGQTEPGAPAPPSAVPASTETPGSDNYTFSVPITDLPGRQLSVFLDLSYNSLLWHRSTDRLGGSHMTYDVDAGWPAPGFRLGYGYIEAQGTRGFTLVEQDGTRHQLVKVSPSNPNDFTYETVDGTFMRFVGGRGWGTLTNTDGTRVEYGAAGDNPRSYPIKVTDRNGNYAIINYRDGVGPHLSTIQDSMGRYVRFHYQGNDLVSVTVPGYAGGPDRQAIRFYYEALPITGTFQIDRVAPPAARVIRYVYFPGTQSGYRYDYSSYGMIYRVNDQRGMSVSTTEENQSGVVLGEGTTAASTEYNYPTAPSNLPDTPSYTQRADRWAGRVSSAGPTLGDPAVYTFMIDKPHGVTVVTAPDGTQTITNTILNRGSWDDGLVREIFVKQGARTFSRTLTTWEHDGNFRNPRPKRVDATDERGETRSTVYTYTSFNNVSTVSERGFGGEELRRTQTAYETRPEYVNRGLMRLPVSVSVFDGPTNSIKSQIEYAYDGAGSSLLSRHDIIMHDPAYNPLAMVEETCLWEPDPADPDANGCEGPGACDGVIGERFACTTRSPYRPETNARGNLSSVTTYPRASDPAPETAVVYRYARDIAGNTLSETADCCKRRTYVYEKAYEYAYATVLARGDADQLQTRVSYDFNTGMPRTNTDENGQTTTVDYDPQTTRRVRVTRPDGGFTQTAYDDGAISSVTTDTLVEPGRFLTKVERFDGSGELVRAAVRTPPDGWALIDYEYDALRRPSRVSNPYYDADPNRQGSSPSAAWTTFEYDGMGRRTASTSPDGNTSRADFSGRVTTTTDQAGRQRRTLEDALGRVERVDEPDASGNLGALSAPAQPTSYAYDALDNLVKITQGQQQRFWRYDSMGRMTHQRQVEQGATIFAPDPEVDSVTHWSRRYEYTEHSQPSLAEDARGVRTTFTYDGVNRVSQVSYSDGTPTVAHTYDEARAGFFNRGQLTRVTTAAVGSAPATAHEFDYDRMGRVSSHRQSIDRALYTLGYEYNFVDRVTTQVYPSGRRVAFAYDDAARLTAVADTTGGQNVRTYAAGIRYAPHGAVASENFGNGAVHSLTYNSRLQVKSITLARAGAVLQHYAYAYGKANGTTGAVDESKNAGQIARVDDFVQSLAPAGKRSEQRYQYDALGRLDLAAEHRAADGALMWRADYAYDRYGNRMQSKRAGHQNFNIGYFAVEAEDVDPATNRLRFATNNFEYDASGNIKTDPVFRQLKYEYDAASRMRRTINTDGGAETLSVYDGLGSRVINAAGGESHHFVYDKSGQIVSEFGPNGWERDRVHRAGELLATEEAVGTCRKTVEQFVESFYRGALDRAPTAAEAQTWATGLRNAQPQGQAALLAEAKALGVALFTSADYAARQRSDSEFVNDLYWGYLQRAPDAGGHLHWLDYTRVNGRSATITAFGESIEFNAMVGGLCHTNQVTGEAHWAMLDHLGSVRVVTDSQGAVIGRRDNLPFGQPVLDVGVADPQGMNSLSSAATTGLWNWHNSIRTQFAKMEKDVATGLDHTPFRKYESAFGRWTSPDPYPGSMNLFVPQSLNRYSYVLNDPVNLNDPSGLILPLLAAGFVIGFLANTLAQVGTNLYNGKPAFENFSFKNALIAGGAGATLAGLGVVAGGSYLAAAGFGAAVNTGQYAATQYANGQPVTWQGAGVSATVGALTGGLAGRAPGQQTFAPFDWLRESEKAAMRQWSKEAQLRSATVGALTAKSLVTNAVATTYSNAIPSEYPGPDTSNSPLTGGHLLAESLVGFGRPDRPPTYHGPSFGGSSFNPVASAHAFADWVSSIPVGGPVRGRDFGTVTVYVSADSEIGQVLAEIATSLFTQ